MKTDPTTADPRDAGAGAEELIHLCGDECPDDCALDGQPEPTPAPSDGPVLGEVRRAVADQLEVWEKFSGQPIDGETYWQTVARVAVGVAEPVVAALVRAAEQRGEEPIRRLHVEETTLTCAPGCGPDGNCSHDDECPEDYPFKVCAHCREVVKEVDAYALEETPAFEVIRWPCATIRALDGSR